MQLLETGTVVDVRDAIAVVRLRRSSACGG
jgi:hypothetical protein